MKFWSWATWENIAVSVFCGTSAGIVSVDLGADAFVQATVTGVSVVVASIGWEIVRGK